MALTKFNFNSFDLTTVASTGLAFNASSNGFDTAASGALNLISTNTISTAVSSIDFTSSIDNTYDVYLFTYTSIHPANDSDFSVNFSVDGGSNYNVNKTTTFFRSYHREDDAQTGLGYLTGYDLAQGTSEQSLGLNTDSSVTDTNISGKLYLFSPSNTTFVKHFISMSNGESGAYSVHSYVAGYCNTTSAVNAVRFLAKTGGGAGAAGGNLDSGTIKMYGIA